MNTNIERLKYTSPTNGSVTYLEINHTDCTYSTDYYLVNGGHHTSKLVQMKEVKRLTKWASEVLEYMKVGN